MKNEKLDKLSKKFGMASKLTDELSELVDEIEMPISTTIVQNVPEHDGELVIIEEESVFSTSQLKTDFLLIKQNLIGLITKGQRILDTAMLLDLTELKASQLDALTNLQNSIANNLKLLISIYREIAEIEKLRLKQNKLETVNTSVNMGSVVNNNLMFNGTPLDLINLIDKHTKS